MMLSLRRKFSVISNYYQCVYIAIFITVMLSGSILLNKNQNVIYNIKTPERTTQESFSLAPIRHVTKSLLELGKMDEINQHVLFFNHIPYSGAEVLVFLLQKLQGFNNYRHIRLKGGSYNRLTKIQQEEFVYNLYDVMRDEAVPLSFDRQIYFINFTSFDKQSPTFINIIRDPADKVLSRSSYSRNYKNKIAQCLLDTKRNCDKLKIRPDELSIPYFCGHDAKCGIDSKWALQVAKNNVEKYYPVVGVLEEFNVTLEIFENKLPYFFKGVQRIYKTNIVDKFNMKRWRFSDQMKRSRLKQIFADEYEFYDWIKMRLFQQLQVLYGEHNSH